MEIRAVVFDIGGVLEITPDLGLPQHWEARLNLPAGDFLRRLAPVWATGSIGTISLPEVHRQVAQQLEISDCRRLG